MSENVDPQDNYKKCWWLAALALISVQLIGLWCISIYLLTDSNTRTSSSKRCFSLDKYFSDNYPRNKNSGLVLYPTGTISSVSGRVMRLDGNVNSRKAYLTAAKEFTEAYNRNTNSAACKLANLENKHCTYRDNFGLSSGLLCFYLRIEHTKGWEPRGFWKTDIMPNYHPDYIPTLCRVDVCNETRPGSCSYRTVPVTYMWPEQGIPKSYFPLDGLNLGCSPPFVFGFSKDYLRRKSSTIFEITCEVLDENRLDIERVIAKYNFSSIH